MSNYICNQCGEWDLGVDMCLCSDCGIEARTEITQLNFLLDQCQTIFDEVLRDDISIRNKSAINITKGAIAVLKGER